MPEAPRRGRVAVLTPGGLPARLWQRRTVDQLRVAVDPLGTEPAGEGFGAALSRWADVGRASGRWVVGCLRALLLPALSEGTAGRC